MATLRLCLLALSMAMSAQAASPPPLPPPHLPHMPHALGDPPSSYSMNSRIIISALGILFFIVFTIVVLHMYAKWCWWRRAHLQQRMLAQLQAAGSIPTAPLDPTKPCALDKHVVAALPTFAYMLPQRGKTPRNSAAIAKPAELSAIVTPAEFAAIAKPAECAVCLAEFRHGEACKLLPRCRHFFHTHCIDVWFLSNATCPLCRATPALGEEAAPASAAGASGEQGQEALTGLWLKQDLERNGPDGQDDLVLLSSGIPVQARRWKRSLSDKFLGAGNRDALPLGSHSQASPRPPPIVWERSASYSTIDSLRDAESLVELSSRHCVSSSGSPRASCHHHHHHHRPVYHPPLGAPKSLLRVFSR